MLLRNRALPKLIDNQMISLKEFPSTDHYVILPTLLATMQFIKLLLHRPCEIHIIFSEITLISGSQEKIRKQYNFRRNQLFKRFVHDDDDDERERNLFDKTNQSITYSSTPTAHVRKLQQIVRFERI